MSYYADAVSYFITLQSYWSGHTDNMVLGRKGRIVLVAVWICLTSVCTTAVVKDDAFFGRNVELPKKVDIPIGEYHEFGIN